MVSRGDGERLRKVEKDVLITKKVKHKAMELCSELVKGSSIPKMPKTCPQNVFSVQSLRIVCEGAL